MIINNYTYVNWKHKMLYWSNSVVWVLPIGQGVPQGEQAPIHVEGQGACACPGARG